MEMLRDAGLKNVYMGVQSSERVTGNLYDRRVKNQTIADIAEIYHRLGVIFLLAFCGLKYVENLLFNLFKLVFHHDNNSLNFSVEAVQ